MRIVGITLFLALFPFLTNAQELRYKSIDWEKKPEHKELVKGYEGEGEVLLKFEKIVEFTYSDDYQGQLVEYQTIHKKTRVISDDAIQANNKVYITGKNSAELIEAKARVITPENEVIDFDMSNILESDGSDGSAPYHYFAIDGIVADSDIEVTYTILRAPYYQGSKIEFQDEYPRRNMKLTVVAPENLVFLFKSYNGLPEAVQDTTVETQNIYTIEADSVPPMKEEDYSAYFRNVMYVVYKLDENRANYKTNLVSFGEVSQSIHGLYFAEIEKKDKKALKKFVSESGADKAESTEDKIRLIENHCKMSIGLLDGVPPKTIGALLEDGITSEVGMTYLMVQALRMLEVKFEFVLTCNRYDDIFDEEFEHYQVLKNTLFYFPETKKYLAPSEILTRYGVPPSEWTNQKGLFVKEISVGDMTTGLGKVKEIKPLGSEVSQDVMEVKVDFSDLAQPVLEVKRSMSGYSSIFVQSAYHLLDDETKSSVDEANVKFSDENGELIEYTVSGVEPGDIGVNSLSYTGKLKTTSLMEKAGNRYLFKIGELIGPQMEMYQESERICDIEHDHNQIYDRTIEFTVPDGYELSGLDELVIDESYPAENPTIYFKSSYTQEGNKVVVKVKEEYKKNSFDKSEIEDFRRIINAAANFNKVVLFITKV